MDAFGYLPAARKVVVLRDPRVGWDAAQSYNPGAIEIRRVRDNSVAFRSTPTAWRAGAVHASSGDRVFRVDFSALTERGEFYAIDPAANERSESFRIAADVYQDVLRASVRMFYYQRCGEAKTAQHAGSNWADRACHLGPEQDGDCRAVADTSPATSRDLRGGWHDAGDYNKYINSADDTVHALLSAYESRPDGWPDNWNIPESGNGIADLLDEIRVELEWFLRMQKADGSVLHKVSVVDFAGASPPSADSAKRRYAPATASATISAAGVFAHAAVVFAAERDAGARAFGATLRSAALRAWSWLEQNPGRIPSRYDNAGFQSANMEDSPGWQSVNRLAAAVYLLELTGDAKYRAYFESGYGVANLITNYWASPYELHFLEAYLRYAALPGVAVAVQTTIRDRFAISLASSAHHERIRTDVDPYGAPLGDGDHVWGSNAVLATEGALYAMAIRYGIELTATGDYFDAALAYVHRLHGVNPGGHTYLTNLRSIGAESSVDETYHVWFADGTRWDNARTSPAGPAPGFVTGGVNSSYRPDNAYSGPPIEPPQNQPVMKAYRDWNTSWPQNSWEVTECSITYQAAYIRLLAEFALPRPPVRMALRADRVVTGGARRIDFELGGAKPATLVALFLSDRRGRFPLALPGWCLDLGLSLGARPDLYLLYAARADAQGRLSLRVPVPSIVPLHPWYFQATQAGACPVGVQSAVAR